MFPRADTRRLPAGSAALLRVMMSVALEVEKNAQAPRPSDWHELRPGRVPTGGLPHVREFSWVRPHEPDFQDGQDVWLALRGVPVTSGRIVRVGRTSVVLATQGDLPETTPPGRVAADARWIGQRLRTHLLQDLRGREDRLPLGLIGCGSSASAFQRPSFGEIPPELNPDQVAALHSCFEEGVTRISAGPGTGKTTLIGALVALYERYGLRTLVVAPSNRATDESALPICERVQARPRFEDGLVIREGRPRLEEFVRRFNERTDRALIAKRRLAGSDGQVVADPTWIAKVEQQVLDEAAVVVSTMARTWVSSPLAEQRFDAVIVDEAGMSSLPATYHVASLARKAVVLVGDPHQLPPVARSRDSLVDKFLQASPLYVQQPSAGGENRDGRRALGIQYRMDPPINDLANALTYQGRLEAAPTVLSRPPLPGEPLILLDSSSRSPSPAGKAGRENPVHANIARELVIWLRSLESPSDGIIGVLSRYRAQADLLREKLGDVPGVAVSTVHRAQGRTFHTAILDFSAAPGGPLGDYLQDSDPKATGVRLLNTAFSRAQRRVVTIANVPFLTTELREESLAHRMLSYFQRHGAVRTPSTLVSCP